MNLREAQSPRRAATKPTRGEVNPEQAQTPAAKAQAKAQARQQQQKKRQGRETDENDTIIGKGFTAAMKRGVAQAKPTPMHEEMVPQKDGGFIATIQRGFEGLFGKPTSKEEVLRKRGAVWANEYEAVPGDEIDQRVQFFARRLPEDVAGCLKIFRQTKGEYQINDEIVNMEQRFRQNQQGQTDKEIFVFWTTESGEQSDPEPLGLYLSHAANVAYEVKQGGNVITQVPEHVRMSFHEEQGTKLTDGSADARFNAMEVAARQAKMREEAAMEWREKQNKPQSAEEEKPDESQLDRPSSQEGTGIGPLDDALQAIGFIPGPPPPAPGPCPVPPLPAPAAGGFGLSAPSASGPSLAVAPGMPGMAPPPMPGFNAPNGLSMQMAPGMSQQGTFYGVQQAPFGQLSRQGTMYEAGTMSRQGTMYAYGSAAPPAVMAQAYAGVPGYPAPMQRQGLQQPGGPSHSSMYAYGSAYAVPVR